MKVITKRVCICGEEFVLIKDKTQDGDTYYATIPLDQIDENGKLKKRLSGGEMCAIVNFLNESEGKMIYEALQFRKNKIVFRQYKLAHPNATEEEIVDFILTLDSQFRKLTK